MGSDPPLVLVVEDEPDQSAVTCAVLELEGFRPAAARDGRQALSLLEAGLAPAVVVCDMMMPGLDGFGFLAQYGRRGKRAPVLAVSAFDGYLDGAREAGAAATLRKPFEVARFVELVAALAAGRAATDADEPDPATEGLERTRLDAVLALSLDQPAPDGALDAFATRVARIFEVPVCLVSIVTADRQSWQGFCGMPADLAAARGGPREESFCTHAVAARAALVVQDTTANPFFRGNRLVRDYGLRFYAGVPLLSREGHALGTLCLLDFAPRGFSYFDLELLGVLARRVVAELEWRERREHPELPHAAFRHLDSFDEELGILGRQGFEEALLAESLRAAEQRRPLAVAVVGLAGRDLQADVARLKEQLPRAHLGRLAEMTLGVAAPGLSAAELAAAVRASCGAGASLASEDVPAALGTSGLLLARLQQQIPAA